MKTGFTSNGITFEPVPLPPRLKEHHRRADEILSRMEMAERQAAKDPKINLRQHRNDALNRVLGGLKIRRGKTPQKRRILNHFVAHVLRPWYLKTGPDLNVAGTLVNLFCIADEPAYN